MINCTHDCDTQHLKRESLATGLVVAIGLDPIQQNHPEVRNNHQMKCHLDI